MLLLGEAARHLGINEGRLRRAVSRYPGLPGVTTAGHFRAFDESRMEELRAELARRGVIPAPRPRADAVPA
jgi:hypothetical protein